MPQLRTQSCQIQSEVEEVNGSPGTVHLLIKLQCPLTHLLSHVLLCSASQQCWQKTAVNIYCRFLTRAHWAADLLAGQNKDEYITCFTKATDMCNKPVHRGLKLVLGNMYYFYYEPRAIISSVS